MEWKHAVCMRDCYDTCSLLARIENGKLVVRANNENRITDNFLCPKGYILPDWFMSGERLRYPLLRTAPKPGDNFREISMEEAVSIAARKIKETIKNYGAKSVLLYYYYGDRGLVNANFPHRLFNYLNTSIVDDAFCDRAGDEALRDVYGTSQGMDPLDLVNENLIVYWGINAAWTNMHGFRLARKYGLEIWSVDVIKTQTARMSHRFFRIRPESDTLFALGIAKILVEEGMYDMEFVKEHVLGFSEFRDYLKGFSISKVSRVTGLSERDIREFSENFWEKRGVVHIGYGFQRTLGGGEAVRAISMLPALVGKLRGFIYSNRILPRDYARGISLRKSEGYRITHQELGGFLEDGKIKLIYIYGTNPLATVPEQERLRNAILDSGVYVILHDIFLTDTALYSDLVFPASTFFERLDVADSYYHRYLALNEQITGRAGISNSELTRRIARAMNITERMLYESDEEVILHELESIGISYEELRERGVVHVPLSSLYPQTESGKIEFSSSRAVGRGRGRFPWHLPEEISGKLKLISPTYLYTTSSQYHNILRKEDRCLHLNPEDARERGIEDDSCVMVSGGRGTIKTCAKVDENVPKGVVMMYKAFWPSIMGFNVNFITSAASIANYGHALAVHSSWVDVEIYDEEITPLSPQS